MKANERKINSMVKELKCGRMARNIKADMLMERNKERESLYGQIAVILRVSFMGIISMDQVSIIGMMEGSMKGNENLIKWMGLIKYNFIV